MGAGSLEIDAMSMAFARYQNNTLAERLGKLTEDSFVDNSELKKLLGWEKMPVVAEDGMRMTLESFW